MTLVIPKKRGRPSKADIAAREAAMKAAIRTDEEILTDLKERFRILSILTEATVSQNVRALTVTGAPGVGKTYTVVETLERLGANYEMVRGAISAVNLYKLAYEMNSPGSVVVLDDADSIFNDEDALNILKVLCDSSVKRTVHWKKESAALRDDNVPKSFDFNGGIIFISNLDFQQFVDEGRNKYAQHFEALMSRSLYLDLRLHTRNELSVWIEHVASTGNIFVREGVDKERAEEVLSFLSTHKEKLRELSLRTLLKATQLVKSHENWEAVAKVLLLKNN